MTTPEPTGPSDPSNASDPGNPLPARIDDARRQDLNEKLTLAVGQGRIDLSEFSTITDAVWSVTDVDRFARLEQLIAGKSATPDDAEIDRLAEKAGPSPESGTDNPPAKKPKGSISSFSAAISNFEATTVVPHDHVPTQSSWFGDIELTSTMQLGERQGYSLVFGDLTLDLREASLTASTTVLQVSLVFGSVKLTVPPGVQVVNQMTLPFGDVKVTQREGGPAPNYPDAPTVVLTGRSTFGDLRVRVAEPGEKQSFWSWLTEG
ncbi:MAG TPA: cell wall-active antibiotics response protein [Candidatus Corynebacterium faecigallinarum]|uniref:Cell wall-active antibiotics response protein n=1 Tax=Candidatus Corynebacterium faecigallinarum TaxID=2838528 RepID=A0A9D2QDD2_9CORY|nr:cell wall-active antibiotics response protein [Candidatus Corynebacterium faecigallinarum]